MNRKSSFLYCTTQRSVDLILTVKTLFRCFQRRTHRSGRLSCRPELSSCTGTAWHVYSVLVSGRQRLERLHQNKIHFETLVASQNGSLRISYPAAAQRLRPGNGYRVFSE